MAVNSIGPIGRAWLKWKSLRLPWRKRFLVGYDLQGNTYWEFRLTTRGDRAATPNALGEVERWRRIVEYPRATHLSAVKVSPLWHQWLRYTREHAPSLDEQRGDVVRQARMKQLAAEADARWAAKPKVMEDPLPGQQSQSQSALPDAGEAAAPAAQDTVTPLRADSRRRRNPQRDDAAAAAVQEQTQQDDGGGVDPKDPWKQARKRGPSEDWQPQAWSPNAKK